MQYGADGSHLVNNFVEFRRVSADVQYIYNEGCQQR
jgi:hypothetical protein